MIDFFIIIALIAVIIGSYTDIKTLEVPDWLNYSLVAIGLGGNLIYSIAYNDTIYIFQSLLGFGVSILFGLFMFYTGQWGGGDSKMIFGLGALLGLSYPLRVDFYVKFLINMLFFGAAYGLIWIIIVSVKYRKKLAKRMKFYLKKYYKIRIVSSIIIMISLLLIFFIKIEFKFIFVLLLAVLYFMNFLFIYVKAVEEVAMIKLIEPSKLTEGDWIVDNIKINNKLIVGPKDLGIKKDQIKQLIKFKQQGKIRKVKVKYGIPFVPSFMLSMIYTIIFNNIVLFYLVF